MYAGVDPGAAALPGSQMCGEGGASAATKYHFYGESATGRADNHSSQDFPVVLLPVISHGIGLLNIWVAEITGTGNRLNCPNGGQYSFVPLHLLA